jgi:hypothetical protein
MNRVGECWLIGFAGLGFMAYRRKAKPALGAVPVQVTWRSVRLALAALAPEKVLSTDHL